MIIAKNAHFEPARIIEANGAKYEFNIGSHNHKNGFVHYCIITDAAAHKKLAEAKICYLNRTWEAYRFQSVMGAAANKIGGVNGALLLQKIRGCYC